MLDTLKPTPVFYRLLVLGIILVHGSIVLASASFSSSARKLIDAQASMTLYDYGPSIIEVNGTYHVYVCAAGSNAVNSWDYIRHASSVDLRNWTSPDIVLQARNASDWTSEWSACDPSVVYFNAGDGGYYYLYYGGGNGQIYVARSATPNGPFAKYTISGWKTLASAIPVAVALPQNSSVLARASNAPQVYYGAGEPSVVAVNHQLLMWYSDDTSDTALGPSNYHVYRRSSTDGVHWGASRLVTSIPVADAISVEVKFDSECNEYILFTVENQISLTSQIATLTSHDGIIWSNHAVICDSTCLPHYSSNVGVSSDAQGHLNGHDLLIGYGAPYALDGSNAWGAWSLWGNVVALDSLPALRHILRAK